MLIWGFIGAIATILMILPNKSTHWVAALLLLISNIAYGASYVFFLAYIPVLTRWHPDYVRAMEARKGEGELRKIEEDVGNKISTHAQAAGYASGIVLLVITAALGFILTDIDKTFM
jgi:MFS transporter, UMF1 family